MRSPRIELTDRFVAAVLAVILVFGMLPATVLATQVGNSENESLQTVSSGDDESYQTTSGGDVTGDVIADDGEVAAADNGTEELGTDGEDSGNEWPEDDEQDDNGSTPVTITTSVNGSGEVQLSKEEKNILTVSGGDSGKGEDTVTAYAGDNISVSVIPAKGSSRIKSILINGEEKLPANADTKSSYEMEGPLTVSDGDVGGIKISASFINYYTVSYNATAGGTVELKKAGAVGENTAGTDGLAAVNAEEEPVTSGELEVDEGESVILTVTPDDGYRIASVTIGNDPVEITTANRLDFEESIMIEKNTNIVVVFERYYTVTVNCNTDSGIVTVSGGESGEGGTVIVTGGKEITVTATPYKNYRVSKVEVKDKQNNTIDEITKEKNSEGYEKKFPVDQDYTIEITFSPNKYNIVVASANVEHISLTKGNLAYYGAPYEFTVTSDPGYNIKSITVTKKDGGENNEVENSEVEGTIERTSDRSVTVRLKGEDITGDITLAATFEAIPMTTVSREDLADEGVTINGLESSNSSYEANEMYFWREDASDASVTFSSTKGVGIAVGDLQADGKRFEDSEVNLTNSTKVSSIALYKNENEGECGQWFILKLDKPIYIIFDRQIPEVVLKPDAANGNGYYNKDVNVAVTVNENVGQSGEMYSGIKMVEYWIVKDGDVENPTQHNTLYSFESQLSEGSDISYEDLRPYWAGNIRVDSELNNSSDVVVYVRTVDNAGNENTREVHLDIDVTAPQIRISFDNNSDNGGNTYFNAERTATIVITEHIDDFKADVATRGVRNNITAVDGNGTPVPNAYVLSDWVTEENSEDPEFTTHTATVRFIEDANYTFAPAYTDQAGNVGSVSYASGTVAASAFTIDTHAPTGTVKAVSSEGRSTEWSTLLNSLNFGYWSRSGITITASSQDETSPVVKTQYYKVSSQNTSGVATVLNAEQLDRVSAWTNLGAGLSVGNSEKFVVYIKLEDAAGNCTYLCTDGLMVDADAPVVETIEPSVTIQATQNNSDLYNEDVEVRISVTDPLVGGTYSGLRTVTYTVTSLGTVTESETLFSFDMENPTESDLIQTWDGSVTVSAQDNNSNEVVFEVFAEDNSGNSVTKDVTFSIDVTPPEINVSYNNNSVENDSYFNEDRTATITVRERNFQAENVTVEITNTEEVIPVISDWSSSAGSGNGDDTIWTATITYSVDGDYTFNVTCTDMAGNEAEEPLYGDSVMPTEFTIDKTLPAISVSYDNNESANDRYFNAGRVATVTVEEHNFLEDLVTFTQTASLDGGAAAVPPITWTNNGDIHTATLIYDTDGDYTFGVEVADMAGNMSEGVDYGNSVAGENFTVDQNIEKPVIRGVENGRAYKDEVVLEIDFGDVNYASYDIQLLRTRRGEKDVDVTSQFITGIAETPRGGSGTCDTFERTVDNDGIYTLNVHVTDMAGNEETETVVFTVNRFGSVYVYDDYLISLIANGGAYVQAVTNDLMITEYNADRLEEGALNIEITLDGRPLDQAAYQVSPVMNEQTQVGDSGWFQYQYTISRDNFSTDGVYKISISSRDASGNTPESTPENSVDVSGSSIADTIQFKVDSTPPEINSIVGLEESIINANEVAVRYTVFDTIGLSAVTVYLNGERLGDSVTDFGEDINNFSGSFVIGENTQAQTVRIVAEDLAGNVRDTDAEDFSSAYSFNRSVTVSTNVFVRWYANKPLFFGSIGGVGAVGGGFWTALALRRRRRLLKVK